MAPIPKTLENKAFQGFFFCLKIPPKMARKCQNGGKMGAEIEKTPFRRVILRDESSPGVCVIRLNFERIGGDRLFQMCGKFQAARPHAPGELISD